MSESLDPLALSDEDVACLRFRRFLERRKDAGRIDQGWHYTAHAYKEGFESLAREAARSWPHRSYLRIPAFYLARHSMEIHLKATIAAIEIDRNSAFPGGHSLASLWERLKRGLEAANLPIDDEWTIYCDDAIRHFHDFDPTGERFRYPADLRGALHPHVAFDIVKLAKSHSLVTMYCECLIDDLDETANLKADFEAWY